MMGQREALGRIATALERIVELMEQAGPEITPDIVLDADGKLMHCTATVPGIDGDGTFEGGPYMPASDLSAYVVAHDQTAALLDACSFWGYHRAELRDLKATYDD